MLCRFAGSLAVAILLTSGATVAQENRSSSYDGDLVLAVGFAGVYPDVVRGRVTTSGAVYDPARFIASHRYLPLGSLVRVVRDDSGESVSVRILDRGPYTGNRIMDLSEAAARALGIRGGREALVRIVRPGADDSHTEGEEERWRRSQAAARFTIQLGSYSSEAAAETARTRADGAWVQRVEVDGQIFYRLNFGRYGSREDAADDLDELERQGYFGFVKSLVEGV